MSSRVTWDNGEQTIIRAVYEDRWSLSDLNETISTVFALMDSAPAATIHVIIDLQNGNFVPHNLFSAFRTLPKRKHRRMGTMCIVGAGPMLRSLMQVGSRLHKKEDSPQVFRAETVEEARTRLQSGLFEMG